MSDEMLATAICPGCGWAMDTVGLPARYGRVVHVDVCQGCGGLWFDRMESQQLSPGGTLKLLERLTLRPGRALQGRSPCPRCRQTLQDVSDQQRATRFTYRRCPAGHGRFISSYHFMREKHLVRELTAAEVAQLRESICQVNCVNCGAPVSLGEATSVGPAQQEGRSPHSLSLRCDYCSTPVSMVDPQQLRRELGVLVRAAADARHVDPTMPIRLARERAAAERTWATLSDKRSWIQDVLRQESADAGIVQAAIRLLSTRVG